MCFTQPLFISNIALINYASHSASQYQETEAEETAKLLELFVNGTNTYPSLVLEPTLACVAPDYTNNYWLTHDLQRHDEKFALIREIVDSMPDLDMIHLLYEVFVTRCQGPLGNVTHTPTFTKQAEDICGCLSLASPEAQIAALSTTISMDILACNLLAVRIPPGCLSNVCSHSILTTAYARSRLSSHLISSWLVSYTSESSCGGASSVRRTFQEMEVTCIALS